MTDDADFFFANDTILPAQFYADRHAQRTPLQRLALAVLADGLRCYQGRAGIPAASSPQNRSARSRKLAVEAERWLRADTDSPFSFEGVCAALGLDSDWLRAKVLAGDMKTVPRQTVQSGRHDKIGLQRVRRR